MKTTTFRKLIEEIDFNNKEIQSHINWEELARELNVDLYYSVDERLKAYYLKMWYCTDSYVGIRAYFLDGKFVAISNQLGRKCGEDFSFVSDEIFKELRAYLFSLIQMYEYKPKIDILEGLDEEIPNTYKIEYNSQILHKTALLEGKRVKILRKNYPYSETNSKDYFHTVEIQHEDGKKEELDCRTLDFEYNTLNKL